MPHWVPAVSHIKLYLRCPNKYAKIWETGFGQSDSSADFLLLIVGSSAQGQETVLVVPVLSLQQSKPRFLAPIAVLHAGHQIASVSSCHSIEPCWPALLIQFLYEKENIFSQVEYISEQFLDLTVVCISKWQPQGTTDFWDTWMKINAGKQQWERKNSLLG